MRPRPARAVAVALGGSGIRTRQHHGQTLTLISAPKGTAFEAVVACARLAHRVRSSRVCAEVRLAAPEERPASWDVNPKPGLQGEIWMLVVVFEFGYPTPSVPYGHTSPILEEHQNRGGSYE